MPDITPERLQEPSESTTVVEMATPWKISAIEEGLGGKYDRSTIIEMLQQCRGNIDRAFCNLLDEDSSPPAEASVSNKAILKSRLEPLSRSSSPFSTASKRSADDSDSEDPRPAQRRHHPQARERKRRILPDVTVGIAFRDDQNDLVSLRLRVSPEAVAKDPKLPDRKPVDMSQSFDQDLPESDPGQSAHEAASPQSEPPSTNEHRLRRSRRSTRPRNSMAV